MVLSKEAAVYRKDAEKQGKLLTPQQREELLKPYLPAPLNASSSPKRPKTKPVRTFAKTQLYIITYALIHAFFSLYIRIRQLYHAILSRILATLYYHHRTPELIRKDVRNLARLPQHLSVILDLNVAERGGAGLDVLLDDVAEIAAWCACVGIPLLSVYEKTGILKRYIPTTHRTVAAKFHNYFGKQRPSLQIRAPHVPSFLNGDVSEETSVGGDAGLSQAVRLPNRRLTSAQDTCLCSSFPPRTAAPPSLI
jgi:dehydrodolichyl diphosphate syntase complex subunit NUS1